MPRRSPPLPIVALLAAVPCFAQESSPPNPVGETFVLEGRVVDMRGEGVPAAKVWTATLDAPDSALARTVADGEGYFRIKGERLPELRVCATAEGRCRSAAYVDRSTRVLRVEVHDAATVRGVLRTRDGRAVKNAIVRASMVCRVLWDTQSDTRTDGEGRFEIARVPLGPVRIAAWIDGEGLAEVEQLVVGDCEVALTPLPGATTDLRVEVAGLPAAATAHARVSLLPYGSGSLRLLPPPLAQPGLDTAGVLAVKQLPDMQYHVGVSAEGFVIGPRDLTAERNKGPHVLQFTATPAADGVLVWKATVRGPEGDPVAGIAMVMTALGGGREANATSDGNGALTFQCPVATGCDAIVLSRDERWVIDQPKTSGMHGSRDRRFLDEHECKVDPTQALELRIVAGCTIEGRLLLADGRPAALTPVELRDRVNGSAQWLPMAFTTTQRDGTFCFTGLHHFDGPARVQVQDRAGSITGEPLQLAAPGTHVRVGDLRLAESATVEGVVRYSDGQPAPGVRVWLRDGNPDRTKWDPNVLVEVITDRMGRYRFGGLPAGAVTLQLLVAPQQWSARAAALESAELEAGKTYTFDLQVPAK